MKIGIIGFGKMGKAIKEKAIQDGHEVVWIIHNEQGWDENKDVLQNAEVAIEFSRPESAETNIRRCIKEGIPVVSGTTGWLDQMESVRQYCLEKKGAFFYASNFSIGVNILFEINSWLAKIMSNYPQYNAEIEEIHHIQKLDAPSGTAISLAKGILEKHPSYSYWTNSLLQEDNALPIISKRINAVPGTHYIRYKSEIDSIELIHTAHSRQGFVNGALMAAAWLRGKRGIFGMKDLLQNP